MNESAYVSVRDASKMIGVGKDTLYKLAKEAKNNGFPGVKIGNKWFIHRDRIVVWMKEHEGREVIID